METQEISRKIEELERQKNDLQKELSKLKRKPEGKIGYLLLVLGLLLIALAVTYSHNVSAFIGIALIFWGALLLFIRPTQFTRKDILDATIAGPIIYAHNLLNELGYTGTPTYISPRTLFGLRTATIYIPRTDLSSKPTDESLSGEKNIIEDPQAIKLTPPGLGLSRLIEDELKINFSTAKPEHLQNNLEKALVEGLQIAGSIEMETTDSEVQVRIRDTIFDKTIEELDETNHRRCIGDPLTSAIACILARSTSQPVVIEKIEREPRKKLCKITFRIEKL